MFHLLDVKLESSVIVLYDLHYDTRNLVDDLDSLLHEILNNVVAFLLNIYIYISAQFSFVFTSFVRKSLMKQIAVRDEFWINVHCCLLDCGFGACGCLCADDT